MADQEEPGAAAAGTSDPPDPPGGDPDDDVVDVDRVVSALPETPGVDRREVAERYLEALPRVLGHSPPIAVAASIWLLPTVAILVGWLGLSQLTVIGRGRAPLSAELLVAGAYAVVLATLQTYAAVSAVRWTRSAFQLDPASRALSDQATRFLLWSIPVVCALSFVVLLVFPGRMENGSLGFLSFSALFFHMIINQQSGLALGITSPGRVYGPPLRPLDRVGTRLVAVAAVVNLRAGEFDALSARRSRSLVVEMEMLAREAERFALPRVPWWDRRTRLMAQTEGLRLAAVVRRHKVQLATAVSGDDYVAVARSLTGGASAWARRDLATMIRDAPEVAPPRTARRILARFGPATVVLALAVAVPLLPPLNQSPQAAESFRTALLIASLLSLTTGTAQTDYVKSVVDKAVLGG